MACDHNVEAENRSLATRRCQCIGGGRPFNVRHIQLSMKFLLFAAFSGGWTAMKSNVVQGYGMALLDATPTARRNNNGGASLENPSWMQNRWNFIADFSVSVSMILP